MASIKQHAVRRAYLLLVVGSTERIAEKEFVSTLLPKMQSECKIAQRQVLVVTLSEGQESTSTLERFDSIDLLSDYQHGLEALISQLGSVRRRPTTGQPEYSYVSGIYGVSRLQSELFSELKSEIQAGRIDQKFLYWDVRAAVRWQEIAELSTYMTAQSSMNILAEYAPDMMANIIERANADTFSFINFGVGTGVKDYLILENLLSLQDGDVFYFPVDESLSMMQITIQSMQDLVAEFGDRLRIHYVLDEFDDLERFTPNVTRAEDEFRAAKSSARVIALLGGSLGNFQDEVQLLGYMKKLLRSNSDHIILGLEFIAGRSDEELVSNYNDERMKKFLYGPISDVGDSEPDWENKFSYTVTRDSRSKIPNSRTVVGYVQHSGHNVELFQSTKYDQASIEQLLVSSGFEIVDEYFSDDIPIRFGKYVLRDAGSNASSSQREEDAIASPRT
jgi:uncharacterized SAM-dependent methyltransferase